MTNEKIAIIDLDSILFAASWGKKIWDPQLGDWSRDDKGRLIYLDKTEEEIGDSINTLLHEILQDSEATGYINFVKGYKTGSHRYQAKSDYKSNRPKESPKWWGFARQFVIDNWEAVSVDNIEVDDAVNITRLNIPNSFMVAVDKDLLNLEGTHYNWKKKEWAVIDNMTAYYCFWSDMLIGQPGDGIQGIPGVGKVGAKRILYESDDYALIVLDTYMNHYGEAKGIEEFYKNYACLKILDSYEGFVIPPVIQYTNNQDIDLFS